jgi:hypothetical protein
MARISDFAKRWAARRSKGEMVDKERELYRHDRPPDVTDPRAKSRRKGKVTADRWNQ